MTENETLVGRESISGGMMNEQMREALKQTTELLAEYLRDAGGCDHSVGICYCNDFRVLEEAQAALSSQSEGEYKDPQNENPT